MTATRPKAAGTPTHQPQRKMKTAVDESLKAKPAHNATMASAMATATAAVAGRPIGAVAATKMAGPRPSAAAPGPAVSGLAWIHWLLSVHVSIEPTAEPTMAAAEKIMNRRADAPSTMPCIPPVSHSHIAVDRARARSAQWSHGSDRIGEREAARVQRCPEDHPVEIGAVSTQRRQ